uniref:Deoxyuridine 5'-triphosphate nucleotidohydrolase n=1 Tax=Strix occidentalis caurina TaxID=311401 RepID=A0A8D0FQZ6_STROC
VPCTCVCLRDAVVNETLTYWEIVPGALAPYWATPEAAGLDLYALKLTKVDPKQIRVIDTGIGIQIPTGHFGLITACSSLALKGINVHAGVIDADYTGQISAMVSTPMPPLTIPKDTRIAQLVPFKSCVPRSHPTERGDGGFGSTGNNYRLVILNPLTVPGIHLCL